MRETIEKWFNNIPEGEKDLPVVQLDGEFYSPEDVHDEVVRGTSLGERLQEKVEQYRGANVSYGQASRELRPVARERALRIARGLPEGYSMVSIGGSTVTKEQLIEAINKGRDIGESAIQAEQAEVIDTLKR